MSGGVDSTVAALLLKQGGYDCAGAMLKLFDGAEEPYGGAGRHGSPDGMGAGATYRAMSGQALAAQALAGQSLAGQSLAGKTARPDDQTPPDSYDAAERCTPSRRGGGSDAGAAGSQIGAGTAGCQSDVGTAGCQTAACAARPRPAKSRACCSLDDAEDARKAAFRLGMPFYVLNFKACFQKEVIDRFVAAYEGGATPNPCIDCNRFVKFGWMLRKAEAMGFTRIATGHYARIERADTRGRHLLRKGADESKDQSYVLYALTQRQLGRLLLPLGGLRKERAREIARLHGLGNADKRDSQDICFAPDGDYAGFIEAYTGRAAGSGQFLDLRGNAVGTHRGAIRYTVGQRRGLGLAMPAPVYVCGKSMRDNTVTVGCESALYSKSLTARDVNFIPFESAGSPMRAKAKTRYRQAEQWATFEQTGPDELHVEFDAPQRAIAPGQAVVLYDGDLVIGGGTIA
ncbi:MAG: tRNA 2-thiouridine(34) synthase MnmA [Clostridiales bacterium]|nr:tRNA 2-thiouridine(34) synthase MnmA [Clostridiales bacterium]